MRLIDSDAAIDALERDEEYNEDIPDRADGVRDAIITIMGLPSAQQLIPCSERYPDMDERVLVYTVAHEYHVWDCMSNRADNYFWEDEEGLYHDKYEVDMWMPLPEPYAERGTDE